MTVCSDVEVVTLTGGITASLNALRLLWALEDRGFSLQPEGTKLRVRPVEPLTPDDVAAIKRHRDELLALIHYCHGTIQ